MHVARNIIVFFLVLGFVLGSAMSIASATEQAFLQPCPMQGQDSDCPCCKGDCTPTMMNCSTHCSAPLGADDFPKSCAHNGVAIEQLKSSDDAVYDPFITRPPPPIPIV